MKCDSFTGLEQIEVTLTCTINEKRVNTKNCFLHDFRKNKFSSYGCKENDFSVLLSNFNEPL